MGAGELTDSHRPAPGQFFNIVVRSGHVAMLIIIHGSAEMLDDVRRNAHRFQRSAVFVDGEILEDYLAAEWPR